MIRRTSPHVTAAIIEAVRRSDFPAFIRAWEATPFTKFTEQLFTEIAALPKPSPGFCREIPLWWHALRCSMPFDGHALIRAARVLFPARADDGRDVTLFRGCAHEKWALGMSWSHSRDVALSYATDRAKKRGAGVVFSARAESAAIIWSAADNSAPSVRPWSHHKEVILDPSGLTDVRLLARIEYTDKAFSPARPPHALSFSPAQMPQG